MNKIWNDQNEKRFLGKVLVDVMWPQILAKKIKEKKKSMYEFNTAKNFGRSGSSF
jgi:hypothetical protein